ncbi:MAG: ROK family protein [Bacteroidota bacterium]
MEINKVLGIDIGASGIKGGIVNVHTGEMVTERLRIETPQPSTPEAVADAVAALCKMHKWRNGLIGVGFPAVIMKGEAKTAANISQEWIGTNVEELLGEVTNCPVIAVNDADAAGIAEMEFGAAKGELGTTVLITIGSGLGSAVFTDGKIVRNTEFGHFEMKGMKAEHYASDKTRQKEDLSWKKWGKRFNEYLLQLNRLISPDLIILGGGGSKKFDEYKNQIELNVPIKIAQFRNKAGAIGAALYAYQEWRQGQLKGDNW